MHFCQSFPPSPLRTQVVTYSEAMIPMDWNSRRVPSTERYQAPIGKLWGQGHVVKLIPTHNYEYVSCILSRCRWLHPSENFWIKLAWFLSLAFSSWSSPKLSGKVVRSLPANRSLNHQDWEKRWHPLHDSWAKTKTIPLNVQVWILMIGVQGWCFTSFKASTLQVKASSCRERMTLYFIFEMKISDFCHVTPATWRVFQSSPAEADQNHNPCWIEGDSHRGTGISER